MILVDGVFLDFWIPASLVFLLLSSSFSYFLCQLFPHLFLLVLPSLYSTLDIPKDDRPLSFCIFSYRRINNL